MSFVFGLVMVVSIAPTFAGLLGMITRHTPQKPRQTPPTFLSEYGYQTDAAARLLAKPMLVFGITLGTVGGFGLIVSHLVGH